MLEGRRIVMVEDDEIMGASLSQRLGLERAEVQWHRQVARALPAIRTPRRSVDAVICDIRLPDGTGEELYNTLTRTGHPPPFLFITGQGTVDRAVRLILSGAADYGAKPFDMTDFLKRLARIMRPRAEDTMSAEKGITSAARHVDRQAAEAALRDTPLLNIALATGNVGREGGGCCRPGGHQEGYYRPGDGHVGRPAPYFDQLVIAGRGKVHHNWATDH
jgi:DNA-binding NtrC family response regulator